MKKEKRKLFNELWRESYIINKKGRRIFSFPDLRKKLEVNNFTKEDFNQLSQYLKAALLEVMSVERLAKLIWNPEQSDLDVEGYLLSDYDGSTSSSSNESLSSSESDMQPPLSI